MKLFISSDIEGVAGICHWDETSPGNKDQLYSWFKTQMTKEVSAACNGATEAGWKDIRVRDAHASARNLVLDMLPKDVTVSRGWAGDVYSMVSGIDEGFDAVAFVGYHSAGHDAGNPLSHTMNSSRVNEIIINGKRASEFMLHAYAAAELGIPAVFISGDEALCNHAKEIVPEIATVATKKGKGNCVTTIHPELATEKIKEAMTAQLTSEDWKKCKINLPESFEITVRYVNHAYALSMSCYPGAWQVDEKTIGFRADKFIDIMRFLHFVL